MCPPPLPVPTPVSASVSVYQKITIMHQAGECTSLFFLTCDSCHSEVHLSEEKAAARVELAVASPGPVGDCLCSDVDVLYRTSGSI